MASPPASPSPDTSSSSDDDDPSDPSDVRTQLQKRCASSGKLFSASTLSELEARKEEVRYLRECLAHYESALQKQEHCMKHLQTEIVALKNQKERYKAMTLDHRDKAAVWKERFLFLAQGMKGVLEQHGMRFES